MRRLLPLALASLLLTSCGVRSWVDVEIGAGGGGAVRLELASDAELRDGLATFSADLDPVAEVENGLVDNGWTVEPAMDGEWEGIVATTTFEDLGELQSQLAAALSGDGSGLELVDTGDTFRLRASLGPPDLTEGDAAQAAQLADVVDVDGRLSVTFPGEVISANGTIDPETNTVTWVYDEETIVGLELEAEAEKTSGLAVPLAAGAGVVLVVAAGVFARHRQKSRSQVEGEPPGGDATA